MRSAHIATALAVLLALGAVCDAHRCIHDEIVSNVKATSTKLNYGNRRRDASTNQPIRISLYYGNFTGVSGAEASYVQNTLMPSAARRLQAMLNVQPVLDSLILTTPCNSFYTGGVDKGKCATVQSPYMCGTVIIPSQHQFTQTCDGSGHCTVTNRGSGIPNTDVIFYVDATGTNCGEGTIAFAHHCVLDQNDRPVAGFVNFCPGMIDTNPNSLKNMVATAIHEMTHALGFSAGLFPLWRDEKNQPRTPRNADGTAPQTPSSSVVANFQERGYSLQKLITPNVLRAARMHFGCSSLNGAELESQGGSGTAGSHWESRVFLDEVMMGADRPEQPFSAYSEMTLSALIDSGWYTVSNWSAADPIVWGRGLGCAFATDKCVSGGSARDPWCTDQTQARACSYDGYSVGVCSIGKYGQALPAEYAYFADATVGGTYDFSDYCPFVRSFMDNAHNNLGDCRLTSNSNANEAQAFGFIYGASSRCFNINLIKSGFQSSSPPAAGCFDTQCYTDPVSGAQKYRVRINGALAFVDCPVGSTISFQGYTGTLTCRPVAAVCGTSVLPLGTSTPATSQQASATTQQAPSSTAAPPPPPPSPSPATSGNPVQSPPPASQQPSQSPQPTQGPNTQNTAVATPQTTTDAPRTRGPAISVHKSGVIIVCDMVCVKTVYPLSTVTVLSKFNLGNNMFFLGTGNTDAVEIFLQNLDTGAVMVSTDYGNNFVTFDTKNVSPDRYGSIYRVSTGVSSSIPIQLPTGAVIIASPGGLGPQTGQEAIRWRCPTCQ